ncbi:hypothetical protein FA95DRAFT_1562114 [Auriscalpium vulgare]|uniref:Uncharacterized protein n=1 Tax=Auriscalpium vulgare TaxID=40419 RepID=A0ACB8RKB6_9AGAM|nr:hypothetical protein FA95DRAFT_1562114 [Auriscalpium vulgare]
MSTTTSLPEDTIMTEPIHDMPSTPIRQDTVPKTPTSSGRKRTRAEFTASQSPHSPSPPSTPPSSLPSCTSGSPCRKPPVPPLILTSEARPLSHDSPAPPSPTGTEILEDPESPDVIRRTLEREGIKVRDFAHENPSHELRAPEVYNPIPALIYNDWRIRNPVRTGKGTSPRELWRLIKLGWVMLEEMSPYWTPEEIAAVERYGARTDPPPSEFVVVPHAHRELPTPQERVRLRKMSGYPSHPDDLPDSHFFGSDYVEEEPQAKRPKRSPQPLRRTKPLGRSSSRTSCSNVIL